MEIHILIPNIRRKLIFICRCRVKSCRWWSERDPLVRVTTNQVHPVSRRVSASSLAVLLLLHMRPWDRRARRLAGSSCSLKQLWNHLTKSTGMVLARFRWTSYYCSHLRAQSNPISLTDVLVIPHHGIVFLWFVPQCPLEYDYCYRCALSEGVTVTTIVQSASLRRTWQHPDTLRISPP